MSRGLLQHAGVPRGQALPALTGLDTDSQGSLGRLLSRHLLLLQVPNKVNDINEENEVYEANGVNEVNEVNEAKEVHEANEANEVT